jgi:hypothetical protein
MPSAHQQDTCGGGPLKRYITIFTAAYAALILLFTAVAEILKLNAGTAFAVASVMGAGFIASAVFGKDRDRAPTREEKGAFAWRALLCVWLVSLAFSIVLLALLVPAGELRAMLRSFTSDSMPVLAAGIVVFISVLYYIAIRWSFGWYAGRAARRGA